MLLDIQKFLPYLADTDLTEEQKVAYITEVWNFLDAFFTHDLQKRTTEKPLSSSESNLQSPCAPLDSEYLNSTFKQCSNDNGQPEQKDKAHG